jgi:DNA-binding FrmR family transcriptional regulator
MIEGEDKQKLLNRLRRVEGQLRGIHRMVEDDTYCVDVLLQVAAVQGALDKVGEKLLSAHIQSCVWTAFEEGDDKQRHEKVEELLTIFSKYARRGNR